MKTAKETIELIKTKKITAKAVVETFLAKIKKDDGKIKSFLEIFEDSALKKASEIDEKISKNMPVGKLAGAVIAIKDNMLYLGHEITCASKILKGHISVYNSTVTEKLIAEDAIIIGRTNMDEFAMGSSCENSAYQKTANPLNTDYVPGGSSGGSAAAVAADFCHIALGSDTGGSIRQPASFCGIYGLKPTYGTISRYGLVAFASTLDQIGPMAKSAEDIFLAYEAIRGFDKKDSTSIKNPVFPAYKGLSGLKLAVPEEIFEIKGAEKDLISNFNALIEKAKKAGAKIEKINLSSIKYALPAYYILASSEASSNLARFDGFRYGPNQPQKNLLETYKKNRGNFGPEVKRRILLGTHSLSSGYYDAYYLKAQKVRNFIKDDLKNAFQKADAVLMPTTPTAAFKFKEKIDDPLAMYLSDIYTIPVNMAGICAISMPIGKRASDSMPYGAQIIGDELKDEIIVKMAGELS